MARTERLGKDLLIKDGATAIAGATSANLSISSEILNVTTKGSGDWVANKSGMKSWNIDCDCLFSIEDFSYIEKIGTEVQIELTLDAVTYTGSAIINDLKINSGTNDLITYNLSMTGTGEFKKKSDTPGQGE